MHQGMETWPQAGPPQRGTRRPLYVTSQRDEAVGKRDFLGTVGLFDKERQPFPGPARVPLLSHRANPARRHRLLEEAAPGIPAGISRE